MRHQDVRARTITGLSARYHVDRGQAERVARTAQQCLEQVATAWGLDKDAAQTLEWAARLHEVGLAISHSRYHRHGAYLTRHSDLPGFSWQEQRLSAVLIRGSPPSLSETDIQEVAEERGAHRAPVVPVAAARGAVAPRTGGAGSCRRSGARYRQAAVAVALPARLVGEAPADARRPGAGGRVSARRRMAAPVYLTKNSE